MPRLSALLLSLFLAMPAAAQDDDRAARVAVAQDYVDATMTDLDMGAFIRQIWQPMVQQMAASRQPMSAQQIARIEALYFETLSGPIRQVMQNQAGIMADLMTLEELTALRDFYLSEHGGAVMRKMPQLAQAQQPMIAAVLRAKMPLILPKIEVILQQGG